MKHEVVEKNIGLLAFFMVIAVSIGGLTQIVPLFFQDVTNKPVEGMKPRTALELEGRDVYIANGCVGCHSQMIRPFRAETERYGHYSVAGESVWDHPFLWGSKRTGPDLARVGGRYSDEWHKTHLNNPRDVVPESNMPNYPWLAATKLVLDQSLLLNATLRATRANQMGLLGFGGDQGDSVRLMPEFSVAYLLDRKLALGNGGWAAGWLMSDISKSLRARVLGRHAGRGGCATPRSRRLRFPDNWIWRARPCLRGRLARCRHRLRPRRWLRTGDSRRHHHRRRSGKHERFAPCAAGQPRRPAHG